MDSYRDRQIWSFHMKMQIYFQNVVAQQYKEKANEVLPGTADDVMIQAIVDNFPNEGSRIVFLEGDIYLNAAIDLAQEVHFEGAGAYATRFHTVNYTDAIRLIPDTAADAKNIIVGNLGLIGGDTGHDGISFNNHCIQDVIYNLYIEKFLRYGVFDNSNYGLIFQNIHASANGPQTPTYTGAGFCIDGSNANTYIACEARANRGSGILCRHGEGPTFYNCISEANLTYGLYADLDAGRIPKRFHLESCWFEANAQEDAASPGAHNYREIYIKDTGCLGWSIKNTTLSGSYSDYAAYIKANYLILENIYSVNKDVYVDAQHAFINICDKLVLATGGQVNAFTGERNHFCSLATPQTFWARNEDNGSNNIAAGEVVIYCDTAATTTAGIGTTSYRGSPSVAGIAYEPITHLDYGFVQTLGYTDKIKVNGIVDITNGNLLTQYSERGIACKAASGETAFAVARSNYATDDSNGSIYAILIAPRTI
jgi:hypothetical protein